MNTDTYHLYRDELNGLLLEGGRILSQDGGEAKRVTELTKTAGELDRVRNKLTEDQFTVTLVSDFQGGKSTTFCTLCDGRLLSPRGFGIKTSGCQISAQNVNGPERAEIHWRTSKELIAGFGDLLSPYLYRRDAARFLSNDKELDTKLDLGKPADCALILQAAQDALADHQANRRTFSDALLDVARCAALTARFYSDPFLKGLSDKAQRNEDTGRLVTTLKPEEVRPYVTFPDDWDERWTDADPNKFQAREVVFLFISQVQLFLNSPSLAETGIRLLDCPGLFASKWDTQVAMEAMFNSDAILYLFPGRTAITAQQLGREDGPDRGGLRMIRGMKMEHKLFYGWNIWDGQTPVQFGKLAKSSRAVLDQNGFKTDDGRFFHYHARLSLMALMAVQFRAGKLAPQNRLALFKEELGQELNSPADDAATEALLRGQIKTRYMNMRGLLQDPVLTPAQMDEVQEVSGQPQMLKAVKNFVISNKATLILLDNGAKVVERALETLEGDLQNRERFAQQKQAAFDLERNKAQHALGQFESDCNLELAHLKHGDPDNGLAKEFADQFDSGWRTHVCNRVAERIVTEIIEPAGVFGGIWRVLFKKEELEQAVVSVFKSELERQVGDVAAGWLEEIKSGQHPTYNSEFRDRVDLIQNNIRKRWEATVDGNDLDLLKQIPLPRIAGNVFQAVQQGLGVSPTATPDEVKAILARVNATFLAMLWSIKALISAIVITLFLHGPPGWILAAAALLIVIVALKLSPEEIKERLAKKISEELERDWPKTRLQKIEPEMRKFGREIRDWYLKTIQANIVSKPRADVEKRLQDAEEGFKLSQAERNSIADYAKQRREQHIQPLRDKVGDFIRRCTAALAVFAPKS